MTNKNSQSIAIDTAIDNLQISKASHSEQVLLKNKLLENYRGFSSSQPHMYDADDAESSFLTASFRALARCKRNGREIKYAVSRGHAAIIDYIRNVNSQRYILECQECKNVTRWTHAHKECRRCGGSLECHYGDDYIVSIADDFNKKLKK